MSTHHPTAASPRDAQRPPIDDADLDQARRRSMVHHQLRARGVSDARVLEAMEALPRHLFVPPEQRAQAYDDRPLVIGASQTISQPYIVALMSELAEVEPGDRVLDVGTGSGYQAAVLARMGARVRSIEILPALSRAAAASLTAAGVEGVDLRVGDGHAGWPEAAPFDAILVAAAPRDIPQPLLDQLAPGGHLIIPVGGHEQRLLRVERTARGAFLRETVLPVRFVPMTGGASAQPPR